MQSVIVSVEQIWNALIVISRAITVGVPEDMEGTINFVYN